FIDFGLSAYTRNDQAASGDILPALQAGDLVLRDLGYFSSHVLGEMSEAGAFFLSRLRYGVSLHDPSSGRPLALLRLLRPGRSLDLSVALGPDRLPVRVLALPLPVAEANARRRHARANRDARLHHSADYYRL